MKNVMEKVAEGQKIINPRYDVCVSDMDEAMQSGGCQTAGEMNVFYLGYFQGYKAAKAEMKRKEVKAHESIRK